MTPLLLQITDWGPFRGTQTFEFPDRPGLYFLWGRNEAEPRLGANGAGKSRVFEALCWCLFGKISDGLKAGDVANWQVGKKASVTFVYQDGELIYRMTRQWSPNAWTLDIEHPSGYDQQIDLAKDETNQALQQLGLNFGAFLACVHLAQDRPMFADLSSEKKATLLGEILNLDHWLDLSQKAGKRAQAEDDRCRDFEKRLSKIEGHLLELQQGSIKGDADAWEKQRAERRQALVAKFEELVAARKRASLGVRECERYANDHRKALTDAIKERASRYDPAEGERLKTMLLQSANVLHQIEAEIRVLEKHYNEFDALAGDECPTCGQQLSKKHRQQELTRIDDQILALEAHSRSAAKDLEAASKAAEAWRAAELKAREVEEDQRVKTERADQDARDMRNDLGRIDRQLDEVEDDITALDAEVNPLANRAIRDEKRQQALLDEQHDLRRLLDDGLGRYAVFTGWVRWFKELRLELISEAIAQLEAEVSNHLETLGLIGWSIRFAVDKETAKGSVTRGFHITIGSPDNAVVVPWEAWSGGEAQRLRLAIQFGLISLIRDRLGVTIPLEVWDEPTKGMSPQGVQDLLATLQARAEADGRVVWLIDHNMLSFGGFAGQTGVIKTKDGSRFDQADLYI